MRPLFVPNAPNRGRTDDELGSHTHPFARRRRRRSTPLQMNMCGSEDRFDRRHTSAAIGRVSNSIIACNPRRSLSSRPAVHCTKRLIRQIWIKRSVFGYWFVCSSSKSGTSRRRHSECVIVVRTTSFLMLLRALLVPLTGGP